MRAGSGAEFRFEVLASSAVPAMMHALWLNEGLGGRSYGEFRLELGFGLLGVRFRLPDETAG